MDGKGFENTFLIRLSASQKFSFVVQHLCTTEQSKWTQARILNSLLQFRKMSYLKGSYYQEHFPIDLENTI